MQTENPDFEPDAVPVPEINLEPIPESATEPDAPSLTEPDDSASVFADLDRLAGRDGANDDDDEDEDDELDDATRQMAAQVTAAMVSGAVSEGVEHFLKPVKITDPTRATFAEKLAAVLAKHDGAMPPWLARLISEWKEEAELARFLVFTGFEVRRQYKVEQARTVRLSHAPAANDPDGGDKPRQRVRAGV